MHCSTSQGVPRRATGLPCRKGRKGIGPRICETKGSAEDGFIYGLPIMMNYAVMHEFRLDLRTEPMVVSVPAVAKERYYSVELTDGNASKYGYIGSRSTGSGAGKYLIAYSVKP
jgi:Protein of unknown function (DUF1254)